MPRNRARESRSVRLIVIVAARSPASSGEARPCCTQRLSIEFKRKRTAMLVPDRESMSTRRDRDETC